MNNKHTAKQVQDTKTNVSDFGSLRWIIRQLFPLTIKNNQELTVKRNKIFLPQLRFLNCVFFSGYKSFDDIIRKLENNERFKEEIKINSTIKE